MKYILLLVVGLICGCDNLGKLEHSYAVAGCNATVTKHLNGVALHLFSGQTNEPLQVDGVLFAVDAISVKPEGFQALLKELKDNSSERIYIELPRRITEDFIRDLTDIDGIYLVSAHMSNLSNGSLKQLLAMNQLTHIYLGPECGFEAADVKTLEKNNVTVHGVGAENSSGDSGKRKGTQRTQRTQLIN